MTSSLLDLGILAAGLWAGAQNALAGGGSFVTLPALILAGLSPLAANITSTVALFPGQITSGYAGRRLVSGLPGLPFKALLVISVAGGALGALLLLHTPASVFSRLVPWLVLLATCVFAWGSLRNSTNAGTHHLGTAGAGVVQFLIAIYGGYFGGGIGILMLATLTLAGLATRNAGGTKNVLAAAMNASAVALFITSEQVHWRQAIVLGTGAIIGGLFGAWALHHVNDRILRLVIVLLGIALSVGLFLRPPG